MPASRTIVVATLLACAAPAAAFAPPRSAPTAAQYQTCNTEATARVEASPAPVPSSTPGGAPTTTPRKPTIVSPPGAPGAGPVLTDAELLEQAHPRYRNDGMFRKVFLECLRRITG